MHFYRYLEDFDIHFIEYSGRIDLEEGLERIKFLEKLFIKVCNSGKPLKILMDARGYIKENPETHDRLAKISHAKFDTGMSNIIKYTAVLNDEYVFEKSPNEIWFTDKQGAVNWLISQKA